MTMPPWSWSSLNAFETCPKQYYHVKIAKDVQEVKHEATLWGSEVHKHLENRARDGAPLPEPLQKYEPLVAKFDAAGDGKLVEKQMAVTSGFKPTEWFAKDVWCRGIVDIGAVQKAKATLLDWKTGKRKPAVGQLKLFAVLAFSHFPDVAVISTGFVWLKENKIDKETFKREDAPMIWGEFAPRIVRMKRAFEEGKFPPKPSGLCNGWCPVPHSVCSFSRPKR